MWALSQDCSQPETHKDQSTSEYSCPGPQAKPVGHSPSHTPHCQPQAGVSLTWLRVWPGRPDTSRPHRPSPSLCASWALNPHKHLVDGLRDPTPCPVRPPQVSHRARPAPHSIAQPPGTLLGFKSPIWCLMSAFVTTLGVFNLWIVSSGVFVYFPHSSTSWPGLSA